MAWPISRVLTLCSCRLLDGSHRRFPGPGLLLGGWWSGCFVAGFGEGEPLVAEVGDDFQPSAEGFDVGGQGP
jgi:hypothetical protein